MIFRYILLIITCLLSILDAKTLVLTEKDVKSKALDILKAHASGKSISPVTLAERSLKNFIDILDPSKSYFIESDIQKWLYPDEVLLHELINAFNSENFTIFEEIYSKMLLSIERRNEIEKKIDLKYLPKDVSNEEFQDPVFTTSERELLERLQKIKAIQLKTFEKIADESRDTFIKRLDKRRITREKELISTSKEEKKSLMMSYILKAFCRSLDAHTNYFTPFEAEQFMVQVQQKLSGIGAILRDNLDGFTIMQVVDKSPAQNANLKIGDKIVAVNKENVIGLEITEAVELIRGPSGSKVNLTIIREEKNKESYKFDLELSRGEIVLEESRIEKKIEPFGDGIIGYVRLYSFYQDQQNSSADDIRKILEDYKKNYKLKAVLLDLRSNTGGLLPQAVEVCSLFANKGIMVSIKDNTGNVQHLRNTQSKAVFDGPVVILTNKASASASEIVAGTLKDYGRAIIIGDETTFGKGSFQTFTLENLKNSQANSSGEYKVTRGRYYTVSGKSPQLVWVKSDIIVPGIFSEMEMGEKYSPYPLDTDEIKENFEDDLSDIPALHRKRLSILYKHNLQKKLTGFTQFLEKLENNSKQRLENLPKYKEFLTEIKNKNYESTIVEVINQSDLQLVEAFNITKDLSYLFESYEKELE